MSAWINNDVNSGTGIQGILISRSVTDIGAAGTRANRMWGMSWQLGSTLQQGYTNTRVSTQPLDSPNDVFTKGQWHHVALVWGNADETLLPVQRVYVDGQLVAEDEDSSIYEIVSNGEWWIGRDNLVDREFRGLLDDFAIFDSALTTSQIETLYNNGLNGIDAAGNPVGQLLFGDVTGNGEVTIDDFHIIRDNLGKTVDARNLGDLDGNRRVDLNDFQLWLHNAPPELAAMAFAVPEPSSVALIAIGLVGVGVLRRHGRGTPLAILLVATLMIADGTRASAQDLVLEVDRATGELSLTGASATVVDLAGYRISSQRETLVPGQFNGLRDTEPDWVLAGQALPSGVQELNSNGNPMVATYVNNTLSYSLGFAYDPSQAILDAGFGVDVEAADLGLVYYDTVLNQTQAGRVTFVGEKIHNNIGLQVDLVSGTASLKNESPFDLVLTGYLIEAGPNGGLNTNAATFTGVGGSFQSPTVLDGGILGQVDPTGTGVAINGGQSIDIGTIGQVSGLNFSFLLAGASESSRVGFVKYLAAEGDFDANGIVDGRDFLAWQRGNSPNPLSSSDLAAWQANYGPAGGAPLAAASAVPEPSALMLMSMTLLVSLGCRRSNT